MIRKVPRQKRDALGRRLCRHPDCEKLVPKGRRSYCSAACAKEFEIAYFPSRTRHHVYERDGGVCAACGCDTDKLRRVIKHAARLASREKQGGWRRHHYDTDARAAVYRVAKELGFNDWYSSGGFWQADHIQECVRGGWGKGLDNFRTLCTPCHKAETARLAGELARARRTPAETLFEGAA